jgi:1-deoxy-D-xylulose-5-phosphate synthase
MVVSAPKDSAELRALFRTAIAHREGPFAIRYPRGACVEKEDIGDDLIDIGIWEELHDGKTCALLATGSMVVPALETIPLLEKLQIYPKVINCRFIKPLDEHMLSKIVQQVRTVVTIEENAVHGGLGSSILEYCSAHNIPVKVRCIGLPDYFIEHGARSILLEKCGLDPMGLAAKIRLMI